MDIVILFFIGGCIAGLLRTELKLPPELYDSLTIFLLLAIGLKGGEGLAKQPILLVLPDIFSVIVLGIVQTIILFYLLRLFAKLDHTNAAAIAAHYGSVSVATFAVALNWLHNQQVAVEAHLPALLAVMEIPAIIVGILLARTSKTPTSSTAFVHTQGWPAVLHDAFLGKGVALLLLGLSIGYVAGSDGIAPIKPLFYDIFKGALALFLLEMGLIVSKQLKGLGQHGSFMLCAGIVMPLFGALCGGLVGTLLNLSVGGVTMLTTLAASASYIAVPAAMRLALPKANPALSLGASLGITFPFNVLIGIPLYYQWARWLQGVL